MVLILKKVMEKNHSCIGVTNLEHGGKKIEQKLNQMIGVLSYLFLFTFFLFFFRSFIHYYNHHFIL